MTEGEKQLRSEHRQLQEKRQYFLLAASGTTIGFAVTQIEKVTEGPAIYLLVTSIALLGFSFLSGILSLSIESKFIITNKNFLEAAPKAEAQGHDRELFKRHVEKVSYEPLGKKLSFWRAAQIWALFAGGLMLPVWKLLICDACVESLLQPFK